MRTVRIAPSVLAADLGRLAEQLAAAESGGADWVHIDVMDGHFVPNLTFGAPLIKGVSKISRLPIDVHLMVEHPERYIEEYADLGATLFTFHPEATVHVQRHLATVREAGMRAGLALNPSTPLSAIEEVLLDVDLVLVMSVNPGFGGQDFLPSSLDKIRRLKGRLEASGSNAVIEVDGGISHRTVGPAFHAGVDVFVAGTSVFGARDIAQAVRDLRNACRTTTVV
jgi:ribulose-phosphate 3-epimerase